MLADEEAVNLRLRQMRLTRRQRAAILVGYAIQALRPVSPSAVKLAALNLHRPCVGDALCIARLEGFRIIVSPRDYCGCVLYYHGIYEREQTRIFERLIEQLRPDTFLDIGANLGYYSLTAAAQGVARVISLEPSPEICEIFQASIALNPRLAPRIEPTQAAASDCDGEIAFWMNDSRENHGLGSIVGSARGHAAPEIGVRGVRVDSLLDGKPLGKLLCKIDVEGAEQRVLDGMSRTIEKSRPTFLIEVHPRELSQQGQSAGGFVECLRDRSYQLHVLASGKEIPLGAEHCETDANFCLVARPR